MRRIKVVFPAAEAADGGHYKNVCSSPGTCGFNSSGVAIAQPDALPKGHPPRETYEYLHSAEIPAPVRTTIWVFHHFRHHSVSEKDLAGAVSRSRNRRLFYESATDETDATA